MIEQYLLDNHKPVYTMVQKILHVKNMSQDTTTDQMIFNIMEKKYNITEKLNNIIKESSVDCIQNSRDDVQLNNKCLRFSEKLKNRLSTTPTSLKDELDCNIFLKCKDLNSFSKLRELKDNF